VRRLCIATTITSLWASSRSPTVSWAPQLQYNHPDEKPVAMESEPLCFENDLKLGGFCPDLQ
jgi:hypothetical protein